jgi:hypothetical protein
MVNHPSLITQGRPGKPGSQALMTKKGAGSKFQFQPKIFIDNQTEPMS